jgi:hypothetical protein
VLGPLLIGLFAVLAVPSVLMIAVLIDTMLFSEAETDITLRIVSWFAMFNGLPSLIAGPLL